MPYQPQRFIHAANVRLDVPVSVYLSEQLTDELRRQLEDATLISFDSVIQSCIELAVDYLLLSGNIFVEADRSLRARLALLRGCRALCDKGIPVFVLPGDTDPPEAWRAISGLPDNVRVCYSSSAEPVELQHSDRTVTTVGASMWYGETDAFGIRVIHSNPDGIEPFRIGTVSRARFDESRRTATLTNTSENNLIGLDERTGDEPKDDSVKEPTLPEGRGSGYEASFRDYMQKLMGEGRLNYLALSGELERSKFQLETGIVHCPGTTQPRTQLEADSGLCSLVIVDGSGNVSIQEINTSAVDWKNVTLRLAPGMELNHLLEQMRCLLMKTSCSPSNRIWSVSWIFTGPLPVLRSFVENDLERAVTMELDELEGDKQPIRLLHQIRMLPDAWDLQDTAHLAQQYADLIPQNAEIQRNALLANLDESELSEGWVQRLNALADGIDPLRLIAQLRNDGADWFVANLDELLPPEPEEGIAAETDSDAVPVESTGADADVESGDLISELTSESAVMMTEDHGKEDPSEAGPTF